jgi:hypothetical protein
MSSVTGQNNIHQDFYVRETAKGDVQLSPRLGRFITLLPTFLQNFLQSLGAGTVRANEQALALLVDKSKKTEDLKELLPIWQEAVKKCDREIVFASIQKVNSVVLNSLIGKQETVHTPGEAPLSGIKMPTPEEIEENELIEREHLPVGADKEAIMAKMDELAEKPIELQNKALEAMLNHGDFSVMDLYDACELRIMYKKPQDETISSVLSGYDSSIGPGLCNSKVLDPETKQKILEMYVTKMTQHSDFEDGLTICRDLRRRGGSPETVRQIADRAFSKLVITPFERSVLEGLSVDTDYRTWKSLTRPGESVNILAEQTTTLIRAVGEDNRLRERVEEFTNLMIEKLEGLSKGLDCIQGLNKDQSDTFLENISVILSNIKGKDKERVISALLRGANEEESKLVKGALR